jgi:hypothetical protein
MILRGAYRADLAGGLYLRVGPKAEELFCDVRSVGAIAECSAVHRTTDTVIQQPKKSP